MICQNCGALLEVDENKKVAKCEYCGNQIILKKEETTEEIRKKAESKSYGYHKGKLEAEQEIENKKKRKNIFGKIIAVVIFLVIGCCGLMITELQKPKVDPFEYIEISFVGEDGDGDIEIKTANITDDIDANYIYYEASKKHDLSVGETITITATSDTYRLSKKSKAYTVEGLTEYLKSLDVLTEGMLEAIHTNAKEVQNMNLSMVIDTDEFISMEPVKMMLITDEGCENILYDILELRMYVHGEEKCYYLVSEYDGVLLRNLEEEVVDLSYGVYNGDYIHLGGAVWIVAFESLSSAEQYVKSDLDSTMKLKELEF